MTKFKKEKYIVVELPLKTWYITTFRGKQQVISNRLFLRHHESLDTFSWPAELTEIFTNMAIYLFVLKNSYDKSDK